MQDMKAWIKVLAAVGFIGMSLFPQSVRAEAEEDAALAERIAAMADRYGNSAAAAPYRESLYDAAGRLAEREVRFRRSRFRAAEAAEDAQAKLATLVEWRKLEPQNLFVQMRLIDAHVARLQTADARVAYLKQVVDAQSVHAEVRSHAAAQMARLYLEQSRTQQALETLRKSLLLNGLNLSALNMQLQLTSNGSNPANRISLVLNMVKADPASIEAVLLVANDLANVGMVQQSLQWYGHAASMARPLGGLVGTAAKDYAAELLIAGQERAAAEITSRLLEKDNSDPGAWFLTLLAERNVKDRIDLVRNNALIGLLNRVAMARQAIGVKGATTRPLGSDGVQTPDLTGDAELLKKARPQDVQDYVAAVSDVAWFHVFFSANASEGASYIKAIDAASPDQKDLTARLEGWMLLRTGKLEEGRTKLAGVADRDPLAALGMIRILRQDPSTAAEATDHARKLKKACASGTLGALVHSELGDFVGELPPDATTEAIRDALDRFPREILKLGTAPQDFLAMRLQPQQVGHDAGEPILVDVELRNSQQVPLVLGEGGVARDLWLDVQTRGLTQQWVSGVSYEKVDGPVILQPGTTARWTVRLDRGPLAAILDRSVHQAVQLNVFGLTNAIPTEMGVVPGPCGIRGRMSQMLERRAANLANEPAMRRARATIDGTDQVAKLRLIDQVAAYLRLVADPEGPANVKAMDAEFKDILLRLGQDSSAPVRTWARYRMAQMSVEPAEKAAADLGAESMWYGRLIGAMCTLETAETTRATLLRNLEKDPDATVRALVASIPSAATKPSTRENSEK